MKKLERYVRKFNEFGPLAGPQRGSVGKNKYDVLLDQIGDIDNLSQSIGGKIREYIDNIFGDTPYADEEIDYPTTWDDYFKQGFMNKVNEAEETLDELKKMLKRQSSSNFKKLSIKYGW